MDGDNIKVLSLFDGMSCGQIALERAGIKVDTYYASEIDTYAKQITEKNYPNTIQLGDVRNIEGNKLPNIDLLIGGSPCQGFSISGRKLNFNDQRSRLFFEYIRLLNECKPTYFLFENVGSMQKEIRDAISVELSCEPIKIPSELVSGQQRNRLYWTNIPCVILPSDKGVLFEDILESEVSKKYYYSDKVLSRLELSDLKRTGRAGYKYKGVETEKCSPIVARHYKGMQSQPYPVVKENDGFRNVTPLECERLQTVPEGYTAGVSDTQRYKMIGNGWTVDVIAHIFNNLKYIK